MEPIQDDPPMDLTDVPVTTTDYGSVTEPIQDDREVCGAEFAQAALEFGYFQGGLICSLPKGHDGQHAMPNWGQPREPIQDDRPKKYRTIVADPPWPYKSDGSQLDPGQSPLGGPGAYKRYDMLSLLELEMLGISSMAEDDAHLYLWTTNAFIEPAFEVARSWGFRPKTVCTWVKTHQKDVDRVSMKTGYYFRGATEHFLFCVRGSLRLNTTDGLPTAYLWPRLPHSVKPEAFYDLVEQASPGPYLELFARRNRLGWDTWGNESLEMVKL